MRPFILIALLALCGCDPQADAAYPGQPLVTLHGQVQSSGTLPPLEAAMLWQRGPPPSTNDEELATRAPVVSGFPASFTLHLYQPPPAAALRTLAPGEATFARANAAAVPLGSTQAQLGGLPAANNPGYGLDADHWVMYLGTNVPPASLTAWWLGAALPAGFHLVRATAMDPRCLTGAALDACAADVASRGVNDDGSSNPGTARWFCLQPYRLAPAPPDEVLVLQLGSVGLGPAGGTCP
jgi:hypothetical protein